MMIGLGLGIWTDVRGISQVSGLGVGITSASATMVARTTGKSATGASSIIRMTPSPALANTTTGSITTTKT